jgi:hypothetical protein
MVAPWRGFCCDRTNYRADVSVEPTNCFGVNLVVVVTMLRWTNTNSAMLSPKFHVGEIVTLIPSISRNVSGGIYQVTKQLPHNGFEFEYHIKSANEKHQRIASEGQLKKA